MEISYVEIICSVNKEVMEITFTIMYRIIYSFLYIGIFYF